MTRIKHKKFLLLVITLILLLMLSVTAFATGDVVLDQPQIKQFNSTSDSITVKWNKVSGADGYYVYRRASSDDSWSQIKKVKDGSTEYTDNGVSGKYRYKVKAYKGEGDEKIKSAPSDAATSRTLGKSASLSASHQKNSMEEKISWKAVSGATSYSVYYKQGENGTWTKIENTEALSSRLKLTHGKKYYFKVRPRYQEDGVTTYGKVKTWGTHEILYHMPKFEVSLLNESGKKTSAVKMKITNAGTLPLKIKSTGWSFNNENDAFYRSLETDAATVAPGESKTLSFSVTNGKVFTFSKKQSHLFDFTYDGLTWFAENSVKNGNKYTNWPNTKITSARGDAVLSYKELAKGAATLKEMGGNAYRVYSGKIDTSYTGTWARNKGTYTLKKGRVTKVSFPVKGVSQTPDYPTGCEAASATTLLRFYGVNVSLDEMVKAIPREPIRTVDGKRVGPSIYEKFVGDPRGTYTSGTPGYGAFAPVVTKAMNKVLKEKGSSLQAYNLTGTSPKGLYKELRAGRPLIVWATYNMQNPQYKNSWYIKTEKGYEYFSYPRGTHVMVLTAYNDGTDQITVMDVYGAVSKTYSKSTFEARYKLLGNQAIALK